MNKKEIATLFSGGKFDEVEMHLSENIEWNIYEELQSFKGRNDVMQFARSVVAYFKSVTTNFEVFGIIEEDNKIAIYGRATFIREGKTVNTVHSCDIYEFDNNEKIMKAYSYCNSIKSTVQAFFPRLA